MRKSFTLVTLLLLVFAVPGFAADIAGNWELEMTNQMGQTETWALAIKAEGTDLTIDAKHPMFGDVAGTGTLSGSDVTMHLVVAGGIGKVVVDFEGQLKGDKMEGTRKVSYDHSEDAGGGAPGGAPEGGMPPGGEMPEGAGGPPGGAPEGGGPGGGAPEGGGPGGGAPAGGDIPDTWTAVRK
jgi:hypothetical protein